MPTKQEVLAAIASGELFTQEYQERERQRKMALKQQRKVMDEPLKQECERMREYAKGQSTDVYEGKKSGDYVGD